MTTLVYIENALDSDQVLHLTEDFGDHCVARDLRPGEHVRVVVSSFKTFAVKSVRQRRGMWRKAAIDAPPRGLPLAVVRRAG